MKLKVWPDPDGLYLSKAGSGSMEAVSHQEEMARGARHHSRQALRQPENLGPAARARLAQEKLYA